MTRSTSPSWQMSVDGVLPLRPAGTNLLGHPHMTYLIPLLSVLGMASAFDRRSIRALAVFLVTFWIGMAVVLA
jgi:hypothetical protein